MANECCEWMSMSQLPPCVLDLTGLSIDFDTEQLYWVSAGNSTINRCKLDGSGLEVLEGMKGKLNKASALAIMGKGAISVCVCVCERTYVCVCVCV